MDKKKLFSLIKLLKENKITDEEFVNSIVLTPFEILDEIKIDFNRKLRCDFPEICLGLKKSFEQIEKVIKLYQERRENLLITKLSEDHLKLIKEKYKEAQINTVGKIAKFIYKNPSKKNGNIAIVTAGSSDLPIGEEVKETLFFTGRNYKIFTDMGIAGINRLIPYIKELKTYDVIIVIAGMDGLLPSFLSSLLDVPIIGIPTDIGYGTNFNGLSALLSMLNTCSPGLTVVNINNGIGAAYQAHLICKKIYKD